MERDKMKRTLIWDDASAACNWYAESLLSDMGKPELISKLYEENGVDVEIDLQALVCNHLAEKIDPLIPKFTKVAKNYRKSIAKIPAELSVQEYKNEVAKKEKKLKTLGKLQYCINRINSHEKMYDLIIADYLMIIYHKLSGLVIGQKHKNPTATFNTTNKYQRLQNLGEDRLFRYLYDATFEYFNGVRNLGELFSLSIKELVNGLFEQMVKFEHSLNKTVIEPWVGFDDNGNPEQMYQEVFVLDDDMDSEQEALAYAEHYFNLWLIDQMHTLENGMRF